MPCSNCYNYQLTTCTELILVALQVKCLLSFHATTLAPSGTMDVTVPVSPLPPSVTDCTSHGACVLPALHHTSSKLAFVVYLQILATALGVVGVFCVFGYREYTCQAKVMSWLHTI